MKKNKKWMVITTVICLLPILAGIILYPQLPEKIATHFNFQGEPDGWSSRAFAVFGLPGIMAGLNLICHLGLSADPKVQNIDDRMMAIAFGTIPALSLLCSGMIFAGALGYSTDIEVILPVLMGVLFIAIGNYLPKTKQSYTTGIKLPWTLNSEENWNRTHRLAGFLWVLGGAAFVVISLLKWWNGWVFGVILAVMVFLPMVYSYLLYRKGI